MKKLLFITVIVASAVGVLYLYNKQKSVCSDGAMLAVTHYKVAFFVPAVHPSMDDIEMGVRENLRNGTGYQISIDTYNANGNRTLLRAQAEEIVNGSYSAVVTVGAQCSQVLHELVVKKQLALPQVFCAVDDPVKLGLVSNLDGVINTTTGVLSTSDYARQLKALVELKSTVQKILLVYDPAHGSGLEKDLKALEEEAQNLNLAFKTLEVANANDIAQKLPGLLPSTDVVLVLTDHTVVSSIDIVITLCNRYQVLVYTSELNSVDKGAALGFGVTEYEYGKVAASLAYSILINHQLSSQIPAVKIETQRIKINSKTAKLQGLDLTDAQLNVLRTQGAIII